MRRIVSFGETRSQMPALRSRRYKRRSGKRSNAFVSEATSTALAERMSVGPAHPVPTSSELVPKFAQQLLARLDVGFCFDALALHSVDNAEDAAAAFRLGHDDLHRASRGAVDP